MPPVADGLNPGLQFELISNELGDSAGGPDSGADHGVSVLFVVNVPHDCGVASGALGPPFSVKVKSPTGCCGDSGNDAVNAPVTGSTVVVPGTLMTIPEFGARNCRNNRTRLPSCASASVHGPQLGEPRNTWPSSGSPNTGVCATAVPTCDASGHVAGCVDSSANCASLHACRPSAAEGESARPAGSATVALFRSGVAKAKSSFGACGIVRCVVNPVGESAAVVSGAAVNDGLNCNSSHPVVAGSIDFASSQFGSLKSGSPSAFTAPWWVHVSTCAIATGGFPEQSVGLV